MINTNTALGLNCWTSAIGLETGKENVGVTEYKYEN